MIDSVIGRVVGKYRLLDPIGEGGMGIVYRAEHVVLGSPAAIKVLLPQFTRNTAVVERFFTEAKTTGAMRHPGIVEIFDFGRLGDQAYIIMELLRGEDLTGFLARHGTLPPPLVVQLGIQLLSALEAAHVRGVIHRDVKPDNIYLVRDPGAPGGIRVKVLDFGIAKLLGERRPGRPTKNGGIVGTPAYMSPEQARGTEIDARADLYAVGCILFELLAGRPPFLSDGDGELMAMHLYQAPPRLADVAPHLPGELSVLVEKMLAKVPEERTPSAAWALAALERVPIEPLAGEVPLLNARPPSVVTPRPAAEPLPRWVPAAVLAVALVIAATAVLVIGFL